ncbi:MAG TPA: hypothetical protein VL285_07415 [Bryobacteraceae bacterium]|nr:hypothetical protein [Bryobacteraceae bacterium]
MSRVLLLSALVLGCLCGADVCATADLSGPYALQLSGQSAISGSPSPAALIARLEFDGKTAVTGYSSVNFNGLLLGNPVSGDYALASDCRLTWRLQDDSGAYQHFAGRVKPGARRVDVRQTDRGADVRGVLEKASDTCRPIDFRGRYVLTLSGTSTALATGGEPRAVSIEGTANADGAARMAVNTRDLQGEGSFEVDPDCVVRIGFQAGAGPAVKLRGVLVNGGQTVLAIQTDPGESVIARFVASPGR